MEFGGRILFCNSGSTTQLCKVDVALKERPSPPLAATALAETATSTTRGTPLTSKKTSTLPLGCGSLTALNLIDTLSSKGAGHQFDNAANMQRDSATAPGCRGHTDWRRVDSLVVWVAAR